MVRCFTDTQLAADFSELRPCFGLAQCEDDLRLGELQCLMAITISVSVHNRPNFLL